MTIKALLNKYLATNYTDVDVSNDDMIFARRTDKAIERCEHGFCETMTEEEFLDKLESW